MEHPTVELYDIDAKYIDPYRYYNTTAIESLDKVVEGTQDSRFESSRSVTFRRSFLPGESIYDCSWYPYTNVSEASSACFITTCRDKPIQLFGIDDGLRCSYCVHNSVTTYHYGHSLASYNDMYNLTCYQKDELETAMCLSFNVTG